MAMILIGKNIVKDVHIDGGFEVNIISKDLQAIIPMFFGGEFWHIDDKKLKVLLMQKIFSERNGLKLSHYEELFF
jgi:hypothetical protein